MLLRLKVKNFKSLRDVDIQFGPLTCFVGPNGVGKSNVFDAIQFLRALSQMDIQAAAQSVRSPAAGAFGPRELFWAGNTDEPLEFVATLLVADRVTDDFGRTAEPTATLLEYQLQLRFSGQHAPRLEVAHEQLVALKKTQARSLIGFKADNGFIEHAVKSRRRGGAFASTSQEDGVTKLWLHQDGGSRGQPIPAGHSPRTVVGGTNAIEYPTVLAARREMSSWQLLHLEPSVMRTPDPIGGPDRVDERGGHIASTLARLVAHEALRGSTLQNVSNRLAALVPEVKAVDLDRDQARQQLSIAVTMRGARVALGPRALSDGTLRFLALVTMLLDTDGHEVLCLEEPENGIHPSRIPAAVELLRDFAVDPSRAVDAENPLRQVIINTHSPDVVRQLHADNLLFVETVDLGPSRASQIAPVAGHWREAKAVVPVQRLVDFVGGSPIGVDLRALQLAFELGSAG